MNGTATLINAETKEVIKDLGEIVYDNTGRVTQMLEEQNFEIIYALEEKGIYTDIIIKDEK